MIGVLTYFRLINTESIAWPDLHTYQVSYNSDNLPLGFSVELFQEMSDYINYFRQFPMKELIDQQSWVKDHNGNVITWRLFSDPDKFEIFREISNLNEQARLALIEKMNLDVIVVDIDDVDVLTEISSLTNPTFNDYIKYIQ